jgi:hypothetical protein
MINHNVATPELIQLYLEQGYVLRELARRGQKFQFDNASTVFSNVARVSDPQSAMYWTARYEVVATLVDRAGETDVKLARVGLENLERSCPDVHQDQYGLRSKFLKLKQKIGERLQPK